MKKELKITFLLSLIVGFSNFAWAQSPILNASDFNPWTGEVFWGSILDTSSLGAIPSGGANQTWNYSSIVASMQDTVYTIPVPSSYFGNDFSGSNICQFHSAGQSFWYYDSDNSGFHQTGQANLQGFFLSYSQPLPYLEFPAQYNDSWADSVMGLYVLQGDTGFRRGYLSTVVDGWGSLILPSGTYNNVLRFHSTGNFIDSSATNYYVSQSDIYFWILPGYHYPLLSITRNDVNGNVDRSASSFTPPAVSTDEDILAGNLFSFFPNPVVDGIQIQLPNLKPGNYELRISDVQGKTRLSREIMASGLEDRLLTWDIADQLSNGVYLLGLYPQNGQIGAVKRLVIHR